MEIHYRNLTPVIIVKLAVCSLRHFHCHESSFIDRIVVIIMYPFEGGKIHD
jgi:hypothetical protein